MERDAFHEIMQYDSEYDISNILDSSKINKLNMKTHNDNEYKKTEDIFYNSNENEKLKINNISELVNNMDKSVLSQMVFEFINKRNKGDNEREILNQYGIKIESVDKISGLYMTIGDYIEQLLNENYEDKKIKEIHKKFLILKCDFDDEYLKKKIPMRYENQTIESWINQYADKRLRLFKINLDGYEEEELLKFFILFNLFEDQAMSNDDSYLLENFSNIIESDRSKRDMIIKIFLKVDKIDNRCFDIQKFFDDRDCLVFIYENFCKKKWI